jgi:hypothetical protein
MTTDETIVPQEMPASPVKARTAWSDAITDDTNVTVDGGNLGFQLVVLLAGAGLIVMSILSGVSVYHGNIFDPMAFGTGVGAMLGGVATVLGALGVYKWGQSRK